MRFVGVRRVSAGGDGRLGHAIRRPVIAGVLAPRGVRAGTDAGRTRAAEGHGRRLIFCTRNRTDPISGFANNGDAPVFLRSASELSLAKALGLTQAHGDGVAVAVDLNGRDNGGLAGGTASTLPPWTFATQVDIIHLYVAGQRLAVIALFHRLHPLVFQTPRGIVGDPQRPLQLQDRGPILRLCQDVYPQELGCQW